MLTTGEVLREAFSLNSGSNAAGMTSESSGVKAGAARGEVSSYR